MFGKRDYTITDKCKRPQKNAIDIKILQKRNADQKKIFINLNNIQELFSENTELPLNYHVIRTNIFAKTFKFLPNISITRRNEIADDCITILYSTLYRKLLKQKKTKTLFYSPTEPELFFYYSQFLRYLELMIYSYCFYNTKDLNMFVELSDDLNLFDIIGENDNTIEEKTNKDTIKNFIKQSELSMEDKTLLLKFLNSRNLSISDTSGIDKLKEHLDGMPVFKQQLFKLLGGVDNVKAK